jgi:hypothetical protein
MKAKVKETGEVFKVLYLDNEIVSVKYGDEVKGFHIKEVDLIPERAEDYLKKEIDWEQRRYELAKGAMNGLLSAPVVDGVNPNPSFKDIATLSVRLADALIKELKGGTK